MICDKETLHDNIQRVKEMYADHPDIISFFDDLEREMDDERKRIHDETKKMIDGMFQQCIPRDSHLYINF